MRGSRNRSRFQLLAAASSCAGLETLTASAHVLLLTFTLSLLSLSSPVVHRDLKPENFVFDTQKEDSNMKLIDFGCAKVAGDEEVINDVAGSPYYCAPEVLSESYVRTGKVWKAADMWSVSGNKKAN